MLGKMKRLLHHIWDDIRLRVSSIAGVSLLAMLLIYGIISLVHPAPPRTISMATGQPGGAYASVGEALKSQLAKSGIELNLVSSEGSLENLNRLTIDEREAAAVDVAVVQGGVGLEPGHACAGDCAIISLGAIFYEPLWIFARSDLNIEDLRDLRGLRVAADGEQSGTRALLDVLLTDNAITANQLRLIELGGAAAADALLAGEVDVAVFVTDPNRSFIQSLFTAQADGRVRPVNLARAPAYTRRHGYLQDVVLPRGVMDLGQNTPREDLAMMVSAASLVARDDLHPALQALLLQASSDLFRHRTILSDAGEFPNAALSAFPVSNEARRYFDRGGPSFLRRYLPFWAANLVDRLWVLAIPLITLVYPLIQAAPPVYRWQIRQRIVVWYRELRALEKEGTRAQTDEERQQVRARLNAILEETANLKVPLTYNDDVYRLRSHIRFVDSLVSEKHMSEIPD